MSKRIFNNFKKGYYYLFYQFYKFGEASPSIFPSDFSATIAISALELFIIYSLIIYYSLFDKKSHFGEGITLIVLSLLLIVAPNVYLFIYSSKWKNAIKEFDSWSEKKNETGRVIILCLVILVIVNLIVACNIPH
jgi:hypothetical protein